MIISGVLQNKLMTGFATNDKKILEEAGKLTNEAISNIRTVALLNKEAYFAKLYSDKIDIPYKWILIIWYLLGNIVFGTSTKFNYG